MILDRNKPQKQAKISHLAAANQVINILLDSVVKTDVAVADVKSSVHTKGSSPFASILLIPCLLGIGLLMACGSLPKESADAESQSFGIGQRGGSATDVDVAIARTDLLQKQPEYTGNTTPFRIISVRSQVEARLLALNLDVGDPVKLGQNIGQLDDAILLTELKQAEAELAALKSEVARATNQVSNARADVERARLEVVQA